MNKINKVINVLYVHANNTDIGGADYCLFKLASELDKKRFKPVICFSRETKIVDLYKDAGITTYVINMERIKRKVNPVYLIRLLMKFFFTVFALRKIIRKEKIDIVHGNDLLDIYGPVAGLMEKVPTIQYIRWILPSQGWLKKIIVHVVYRLNTIVMTVSKGVSNAMFSINGKILPNVTTCYDWIDMEKVGHGISNTDIRKELNIADDVPLAGCVGRLEPWKGQDVFIKAAAETLKTFPQAKFLVVGGAVEGRGRDEYSKGLLKLAERLGIKENMIFTGQRTDISDIMSSLDIFVHSSTSPDPLPGVVMEAMFCEAPVIGANAGGVPEEMEDGVTGLLYEPGDDKDMAKKIMRLMREPGLAKRMGINGKKRVTTTFEKGKLCRNIENVYMSTIAKYHKTGG